jgi:hypothetical protein
MNPVHHSTYHLVKAEQEHRLARIERRAMAHAPTKTDAQTPSTSPVRHARTLRRAAGAGLATVALLLSVLVGGVLANEQAGNAGSGGGGGAARISLQ